MRKIKTMAEKIDEMIADYERLNREAHDMMDPYIDEVRPPVRASRLDR
jgi:hypothetical protein